MRYLRIVLSIALFAALLLSVATVPAAAGWFDRGVKGSGDVITEERDTEEFTFIECNIGADIDVRVGDSYAITVSVDDNLMELIRTDVRGGTLEIYAEENFNSRRGCRIDITVKSLEGMEISGSGDIKVADLREKDFRFELSGSGDVEIIGTIDHLEVGLSGSGDIELVGTAVRVDLNIAGSGDIDARELHADTADVRISGSGDVQVYVKESLYGRVSGSGDIDYWGNPADVSSTVQGSGSIQKRG